MNPMTTTDGQVDRIIGSAYQVIKYVAANMETLITLAEGLDPLVDSMRTAFEAIRRTYAEAGFDLQQATFQTGAAIGSANQVLLDDTTGIAYSWGGALPKLVLQNSSPAASGGVSELAWTPRHLTYLRNQLAAPNGVSMVGGAATDVAVFEGIKRTYAENGYNVVPGSFESGGTLINQNDVLLHKATGRCYSGVAGQYPAGTSINGFVDESQSISKTYDTLAEVVLAASQHVVGQKVIWQGRYELSDGGNNWGVVKSGTHIEDGGSIISLGVSLYIECSFKGKRINVRKFGARAVASGQLYDCISSIRACEAYARKNPDPALQQTMYFPCGKYGISDTWHIHDTLDFCIDFDNVHFVSMATTAKGAMILCSDWVQSAMLGKVRFDNTNNALFAKFDTGLSVQSATKGTTKNAFYNVTSMWFRAGLVVGKDTNDLMCSENTFYSYNNFECTVSVDGGGVQTGASFVGCNLLATPNPVVAGPIHAMWLKGGFWAVVGGEVLTTQSASNQCIRMNPCKGANPTYPQLRINGTIVETASPFVLIDNPENVAVDRTQQQGQFQIQGSGGYCGADAVKNANFIDASSDYEGVIQVRGNNFYTAVQRNAFNINAGPNARIETDETSFGVGFRDAIGGVNGGILIHPETLVAVSYNSGGATYSAGAKQSIKFGTKSPLPRYRRYNENFDLATGVYTVPVGGHKSMRLDCSILAANLNGDLFIEVDGVAVEFGQIAGNSGKVSKVIEGLTAGQTVGVFLQLASGSTTLINGKFNYINISVCN